VSRRFYRKGPALSGRHIFDPRQGEGNVCQTKVRGKDLLAVGTGGKQVRDGPADSAWRRGRASTHGGKSTSFSKRKRNAAEENSSFAIDCEGLQSEENPDFPILQKEKKTTQGGGGNSPSSAWPIGGKRCQNRKNFSCNVAEKKNASLAGPDIKKGCGIQRGILRNRDTATSLNRYHWERHEKKTARKKERWGPRFKLKRKGSKTGEDGKANGCYEQQNFALEKGNKTQKGEKEKITSTRNRA